MSPTCASKLQGILAVVLSLISVFSPKSYVVGIGNIVQPLLFQSVCVGFPSANKTALYDLAMNTFHRVTSALELACHQFDLCFTNKYRIPSKDIAVIDNCGSVQATLTLMSQNRNVIAINDEFNTFVSKIASSGDGALATVLEFFNGPSSLSRETLTHGKITVHLPRYTCLSFGQPEVVSEFLHLSKGNNVSGLASRLQQFWASPHFIKTNDVEKDDGSQQSFDEVLIALCADSIVECSGANAGWKMVGPDEADEIVKKFLNYQSIHELTAVERDQLKSHQHTFEGLIPSAWPAAHRMTLNSEATQRDRYLIKQLEQKGEIPNRRLLETPMFDIYPDGTGDKPFLAAPFIAAGVGDINVFEFVKDSDAYNMIASYRDSNCPKPSNSEQDINTNVVNGKNISMIIRISAMLQAISNASTRVETILGEQPAQTSQLLVKLLNDIVRDRNAELCNPASFITRPFAVGTPFKTF
jgi:hypothetical protein